MEREPTAARASRGKPPRAADPPGGRPRARDLAPILLVAAALAIWTWVRIDGYALADSIEYLEHAQALVRGERVLDSSDIRGIGFALVLAPPFLIAEWLGLEDLRWILPFARLAQLAFTLLLVVTVARIGGVLAGRGGGLAAGWIAATSPVLVSFSVEPVADVLATLLVARALLCALEPGGARRNLAQGLWSGAALLVAFKSLLVVGPLAALVLVRDLRRRRRAALALVLGLALGVLVQVALDRLRYGEWGRSLAFYLGSNGYLIGARLAGELGFVELARRLYELGVEVHTGEAHSASAAVMGDVRQRSPVAFYLYEATRFVGLPGLVLLFVGTLTALARPSWSRLQPLLLVVLAAVLTTYKGSKDFRLWLPLLPAVAALCALGFRACAGPAGPRAARWRWVVAAAFVWANGFAALARLAPGPPQRHAGYWAALEHVQRAAEREGRPLRVGSAWHWAVFLREGPPLELVKLPHHLEAWEHYDAPRRARDLEVLDTLDRFVTHLAVLSERPTLLAAFGERFEVEALFFDPLRYRDLGPILVFARRAPGAAPASERVLFERVADADPALLSARPGAGTAWDFLEPGAPGRLRLVGFEVETLPGGHSWLTLTWWVAGALADDVLVLTRIETDPPGAVEEQLHTPLWGMAPSSAWPAGTLLREGRPLVAAARPFDPATPWTPLGGPGAGPDLSAELLLAVFAPPTPGTGSPKVYAPARAGAEQPLDPSDPQDAAALDERGRLRAGRFSLIRLGPAGEGSAP